MCLEKDEDDNWPLTISSDFKNICYVSHWFEYHEKYGTWKTNSKCSKYLSIGGHVKRSQHIIEKYYLSQTICSRTYYSSMDNLGQKWSNPPVEVLITSFLFLVYLILLVPLYIKRRKNEQQDQPNLNQLPKSLESLLMNFGIIMVCILAWILLYIMNKYEFKIIQGSQSRRNHLLFALQEWAWQAGHLP